MGDTQRTEQSLHATRELVAPKEQSGGGGWGIGMAQSRLPLSVSFVLPSRPARWGLVRFFCISLLSAEFSFSLFLLPPCSYSRFPSIPSQVLLPQFSIHPHSLFLLAPPSTPAQFSQGSHHIHLSNLRSSVRMSAHDNLLVRKVVSMLSQPIRWSGKSYEMIRCSRDLYQALRIGGNILWCAARSRGYLKHYPHL